MVAEEMEVMAFGWKCEGDTGDDQPDDFHTDHEPENEIARQLYRSFGFIETGDMDGEELIAVARL